MYFIFDFLFVKTISYYLKNMFFLSFLSFSAITNACMCTSESNSVNSIYDKAEGVYLVAINDISKVDAENVGLKLDVLKVFKGEKLSVLEAIGYARLPRVNKDDEVVMAQTSCDLLYSYGSLYIVATRQGEEIFITQCSDSLIDIEYWDVVENLAIKGVEINGADLRLKAL